VLIRFANPGDHGRLALRRNKRSGQAHSALPIL
jgi:hypothetical protein